MMAVEAGMVVSPMHGAVGYVHTMQRNIA